MNELEYGIIERTGASQRRTRAVFEPEFSNRNNQWVSAYPTTRPVEDWIEENVSVDPDPEWIKKTNEKLAKEISQIYSHPVHRLPSEREQTKENERFRLENDPEYREQKQLEQEQKKRQAQEKAKATRERKRLEEEAQKRQIEIDKPQKQLEFQKKIGEKIHRALQLSQQWSRDWELESIKYLVLEYKNYLDGITGIDVTTPVGITNIKWLYEGENFYPSLWISSVDDMAKAIEKEKEETQELADKFTEIVLRTLSRAYPDLNLIQRHLHTMYRQLASKNKQFAEAPGFIIQPPIGAKLFITWDENLVYITCNPIDFRQWSNHA